MKSVFEEVLGGRRNLRESAISLGSGSVSIGTDRSFDAGRGSPASGLGADRSMPRPGLPCGWPYAIMLPVVNRMGTGET